MDRPLIDHRGAEFAEMALSIFEGLSEVFGAASGVLAFPASATGCWESALVNTLSPGDRVLLYDNGFFASKWGRLASGLGFDVERIEGDWRRPVDPARIADRLASDGGGGVRAFLMVHNETSTGVTSDIPGVRSAMDDAGTDALLMVDAVSSLGATEYRQDEWGVDVTVCGSQKGLMLPPGLAFCAVSRRALEANRTAGFPRAYWDWADMLEMNRAGFFPSTPPTSLLFGLRESLAMLAEEGHRAVFERHARLSEATRRAVAAWGLDNFCADPKAYSAAGTTVSMPDDRGADEVRAACLSRFDVVLGGGLGPLKDRVFRIGHLGDFNETMLAGALSGVEMGLRSAGVPIERGGVQAALDFFMEAADPPTRTAAGAWEVVP